jgi:hypothetical protein
MHDNALQELGNQPATGDEFAISVPDTACRAREVVAKSAHFRGRINNLHFVERGDALIVQGAVPSFYLKQILQELVKGVSGVGRVDNQVDVMSTEGLSSIR